MRHIFILNPVAGKGHPALALRSEIEAYFAAHPEKEYQIYLTDGAGAATRFAREECAKGGALRLYACGGDGTLQEVASGMPLGSDTAELAVVPCGSGNDFARLYGGRRAFACVAELIEGDAYAVDAVDCGDRISLNIASIGMDAAVGQKMSRYKNWPGVSGSMAYNLAAVDVFCHPIGVKMEIEMTGADGSKMLRSGRYLMTLAANGRYYGGGYCGAPHALENDGLLDFVLVKKISRLRIPLVLGKYKAGHHAGVDCIEHLRGTEMQVRAAKSMVCNVDGECYPASAISFRVIQRAFRVALPDAVAAERGFLANTDAVNAVPV